VSALAVRNGSFRWDRARVLALLAILSLHAALIALLWHSGFAVRREPSAPAMQVVMLLPQPAERRPVPLEKKPRISTIPLLAPPVPAPTESAAPEGSNAPTAVPWVDWQQEGRDAARREAQAHPLPPLVARKKPPAPWSHSRMKRIEKGEGYYVFWLNDQCALINFLIPACSFGKKPARGDLFDGMKEWQAEADADPNRLP